MQDNRATLLENAASITGFMDITGLRTAFVSHADNEDQDDCGELDTLDFDPPADEHTRARLEQLINDALVFVHVGMPETAENMVNEAIFDGRCPGYKSTLIDFKEKMHAMPRNGLSAALGGLHATFLREACGISADDIIPGHLDKNRKPVVYPARMSYTPSLNAA